MNRDSDNGKGDVPTIGVLSLQGAFREHEQALANLGARTMKIRRRRQLQEIDALVIPGGESTTIGKLMVGYHMMGAIRAMGEKGMPILGTCAGLVMLAMDTVDGEQPLLRMMDLSVRRNAFGRQVNSFETDLEIPVLGDEPFHGVFIRAPWIEHAGPEVEVLASHDGHAVAARQGSLLVTAFHPELTDDLRLHRYFLEMLRGKGE